ncbi:PREDICTED: death-associated protein kinase 1-like [Ceratosolen solmsi marchali]|uniref:Death-associated protein kinase 1-like n=1 Tax=Ceratosolen solmsi marchali TaxID=326594 RepID=A0AAJ6YDT9_9HYME|nr:PREDICTED: death-associated protein kinase 1-like [Ceratosolen solmsi marchali]
MMPTNSRLGNCSDGFEWDTLMEVVHEPIEKNYKLLEEIGKGQFAIVRKCVEQKSGAEYAAKIMRKRRVARGVAAADIAREAGLLAQLRHPNIVSLYKVIDTGTNVVLLLELITGGELFHWMPSNEAEAAYVVGQVLKALSHLHSHQVAHLDIKPENILLSSSPPMPNVKLIDLGLSHRLIPGSEHRALFGTPEFVAPEIVNYEPLSLGTDLWAVGVLTYILLSGASPFLGEDKQETYANVAACQYQFDEKYFSNVSKYAKDFIQSLLVKDPKKRGTAESCLTHAWILTEFQACQGLGEAIVSAVKGECIQTVSSLLQQGAPLNIINFNQDTLLHVACRTGNEGIVALLIDHGIDLDVTNKDGLTPLHLAAKFGCIDIVRLLCTAGCDIDKANRGIRADVTAIKYGFSDIASLLDKLRNSTQRDLYIKQLQPIRRQIDCLHIHILGHCASGKTSLINSLRSSIFNFGFFKRSKNQSHNTKRDPSIELDITIKHDSLSFEHSDNEYESTIGVETNRGNIGGECVFWELCGREEYLVSYHQALMVHQPMQVHLITISLRQPLIVRLQQARFWLQFIMDRIPPENIGFAGKCIEIQVILVGTYAPELPINNTNGINLLTPLLESLKEFTPLLGEEPQVVALDATNPSCPGLKLLRTYLNNLRVKFVENTHDLTCNGLIDAWRIHMQSLEEPLMLLDLKDFINQVRQINPLVTLEHCKQLGEQLQALGDCLLLPGDLYVLSLNWLWRDIIGWQLNPDQKNRLSIRTTGVYTLEDFQARCPCPANQALQILQAFHLCVPCVVDEEELEYEIPCLNLIERLPGLWEPWTSSTLILTPHAGFRLCPTEARLYNLLPLFPHLQVQLRKITQSWNCDESDLYQWWRGSKLCLGPCECIITLEEEEQGCIQVWIRGPRGTGLQCFSLLNVVVDAIDSVIEIVAPGILLEKHWQSPSQLRDYDETIHSWEPTLINSVLLERNFQEAYLKNPFNGQRESVWDIIGCGLTSMENCIPGIKQPVKNIKPAIQRRLAQLLDPPDAFGRDWCLLTVRLGLGDRVAQFDSTINSPTLRIFSYASPKCTVGILIRQLRALGRDDAVKVLLTFTPTYIMLNTLESDTGSNFSR